MTDVAADRYRLMGGALPMCRDCGVGVLDVKIHEKFHDGLNVVPVHSATPEFRCNGCGQKIPVGHGLRHLADCTADLPDPNERVVGKGHSEGQDLPMHRAVRPSGSSRPAARVNRVVYDNIVMELPLVDENALWIENGIVRDEQYNVTYYDRDDALKCAASALAALKLYDRIPDDPED